LDALDGIVPPPKNERPEPMPIDGFDEGSLPIEAIRQNLASLDVDTVKRLVFEGRQIVRENAARAFRLLMKKPDEGLRELLLGVKASEESVRIAALDSLATTKLDADRVVPAIAMLLFHRSRATRDAAGAAIVAYGNAAVAPLLALLAEPPQRAIPTL